MRAGSLAKLLEQRAQDLINLAESAMREVINDIGVDSTAGMVAMSKNQKNDGRKLAIRTGNLYRSLVKGTDSNAIRRIKTSGYVITGTIGTKVLSKSGFGYPFYHENGGANGASRFRNFLSNAVIGNEQNLRDKLIKKIGSL